MARIPTFILTGQSNVESSALVSGSTDVRFKDAAGSTLTTTYAGLKIYNPYATADSPLTTYTGGVEDLDYGSNPNFVTTKSPATVVVGPELSLGWNMRNHYGEEILIIKCAAGSTVITPNHVVVSPAASYRWFSLASHNEWSPSATNELYSVMTDHYIAGNGISSADDGVTYATGANAAAIAAGYTDGIDVQGIFVGIGESDCFYTGRAAVFGEAMRVYRDKLRKFLVDGNYTTLNEDEIPWVMTRVRSGLSDVSSTYVPATVNDAMDQLAVDDLATGTVNSDDYDVDSGGIHYDADAQHAQGDDWYAEWVALRKAVFPAQEEPTSTDPSPRPTLSELRTDALRMYEGKGSSNANTTALVDQYLNDAQTDLVAELGDNAFWLHAKQTLSWSATGANDQIDMPLAMARILRIENNATGREMIWEYVAHLDGGKPRIKISGEGRSGTFDVYFVPKINRMSDDDDQCAFPYELKELLIVSAMRRLAAFNGKDQRQQQWLLREEERLRAQAKNTMLKIQRMQRHRFREVRNYRFRQGVVAEFYPRGWT